MPEHGMVHDDSGDPAPGPGPGFLVLLVVVGVLLLLLAWGAVVVVLDVVQSLTGQL